VREAAARTQCLNNLKQTSLAMHSYHDVNHYYPSATLNELSTPEEGLSWLVALLPNVEQDALYRQFDLEKGWQAAENEKAANTVARPFYCPAHPDLGGQDKPFLSPYVGMAGVGPDAPWLPLGDPRVGYFGYLRRVSVKDIHDGTSNTMVVIETGFQNGPWTAGGFPTVRGIDEEDAPFIGEGKQFGIKHRSDKFFRTNPLLALVAMGDGSCRSLQETIRPETFRAMGTIAGGERVDFGD
jgi:hypothetical protein